MIGRVQCTADPAQPIGQTGDIFSDIGDWAESNIIHPLESAAEHGFAASDATGWEGLENSFDAFGRWVGDIGHGIEDVAKVVGPIWDAVASPLGDALFAGITFIPGVGQVVGGVVGAIKGLAAHGLDGMAEEALLGALPAGAGALIRAAGGLKTIGALAKGDLEGAALSAAGSAIKTYLPGVSGAVEHQAKAILGSLGAQLGTDTVAALVPDVDLGNLESYADMVATTATIRIPTAQEYAAKIEAGLKSSVSAELPGGPYDGMTFEQARDFRASGGKLSAGAESAFYTEAMKRAGDHAYTVAQEAQAAAWEDYVQTRERALAAAKAIPAGSDPIVGEGMTARQLTAYRAAGGIMAPETQAAWMTALQQAAGNRAAVAAAAASSAASTADATTRAAILKANATQPGPGPIVDNGWTLAQVRAYYDAGGRLTDKMRTALMQAASSAVAASQARTLGTTATRRPALEIGATLPPGSKLPATVTLEPTWPPGFTFSDAIDSWELYFEE